MAISIFEILSIRSQSSQLLTFDNTELAAARLTCRLNIPSQLFVISARTSFTHEQAPVKHFFHLLSISMEVNRRIYFNFQANDPFNRCSTPFVSMPSSPFNHNHVPPHSYPPHQRLPPNFPHAAAAQNYWYSVSRLSSKFDGTICNFFSPDNLAATSAITSAPSQLDDESLHEKSTRILHRCSNTSVIDSVQSKCTERET